MPDPIRPSDDCDLSLGYCLGCRELIYCDYPCKAWCEGCRASHQREVFGGWSPDGTVGTLQHGMRGGTWRNPPQRGAS
jgi:hypothetical protein